jgi:hypothetical protein
MQRHITARPFAEHLHGHWLSKQGGGGPTGSAAEAAPARQRTSQAPGRVAVAMLLAALGLVLVLPPAAAQAMAEAPRRPPTPEEATVLPPFGSFAAAPTVSMPAPDFEAEAAAELKQVGCAVSLRARRAGLFHIAAFRALHGRTSVDSMCAA